MNHHHSIASTAATAATLLLSTLISFQAAAAGDAAPAVAEKKDYFVFLTTGKSTQGIAPEVIATKQAAHLENFGRLAKLGSLTAAGPCADPDKKTRGIVVIHGESMADAESMFGPDPYVSEGFMKTEIHPFQTIAGKLQLVTEVISMEQSVIVIASRGKKGTDKLQEDTIASEFSRFAKKQFEDGKIGFAALLPGDSNNDSKRIAVILFRGKDVAAAMKICEEDALVRDEKLTIQAFPQYLAKGAME